MARILASSHQPTDVFVEDPAFAGQAIYTPGLLRFYDVIAWFNGRAAWRCPPRRLVPLYDQNVSAHHLEIGVGNGYHLNRCSFPTESPQITLMDLNRASLAAAGKRLRRYSPRIHQANALEDFGLPPHSFESIGMNWLLHCLPGDISSKGVIFDHCRSVLAPEGVVFGSTVLNGGVSHTPFSRTVMRRLNSNGAFTNFDDDLLGLEAQLKARFEQSRVQVIGAVATFSARRPRVT